MLRAYHELGIDKKAVFSLFARRLPAERNFLVAAGLEDFLQAIETLRFNESDLAYLRTQGFPDADPRAPEGFSLLRRHLRHAGRHAVLRERGGRRGRRADRRGAARRDAGDQPDRLSKPDRVEGGAHRRRGAGTARHRFWRPPGARHRRRGDRRARSLHRRRRRNGERLRRPALRRSDHRHDGAQLHPVLRRRDGRIPLLRARLSVDGAARRHLRSDRRREEGGGARERARRRVQGARRAASIPAIFWRSPRPPGKSSTRPGFRRSRSWRAAGWTNS